MDRSDHKPGVGVSPYKSWRTVAEENVPRDGLVEFLPLESTESVTGVVVVAMHEDVGVTVRLVDFISS